jgi:hypothetical protein
MYRYRTLFLFLMKCTGKCNGKYFICNVVVIFSLKMYLYRWNSEKNMSKCHTSIIVTIQLVFSVFRWIVPVKVMKNFYVVIVVMISALTVLYVNKIHLSLLYYVTFMSMFTEIKIYNNNNNNKFRVGPCRVKQLRIRPIGNTELSTGAGKLNEPCDVINFTNVVMFRQK